MRAAEGMEPVRTSARGEVEFPRLVFLVNPEAQDGHAAARLRGLLSRAPAWTRRSRLSVVTTLSGAERAMRGLAPDEIPVAAGGDATVNFVARAVRAAGRADRPMAILPLGVGNAIAHALGVADLRRALAAIADGRSVLIDALVTTHPEAPLALASVSCGFEGQIISGASRGRGLARVGGLLAALPGALRKHTGVRLEADGVVLADPSEPVFNVGVYNLPCVAWGTVVHPDADPADGLADAVVHRRRRTFTSALRHGVATAAPPSGSVRTARAARIRLDSRWPIQIDLEGSVSPGELEIRVEPAALRIIAGRRKRAAANGD
ncbi:sphingosine kinase [Anaeromyxobacter dehalogenans 2CP-C]|uniref:Sphingosine kinase n=2 Tax=Anaeromyxobacter dehalogenans TaxID=161493 RepID=Q2IJK6_ANADE|nr:sphingosine kinase [Anaeromyxobacter dehalogenans 2CP-C]